ncbi:MAG: ribonuclease E activity regulator RraA [Gammaproteobacteria bacterium]|nr:ribonuclease E activity regulator RraA [Gammaproteobacteria bacterium]
MVATADLYDAHGETLRVLAPIFRDFGGARIFEGPVATLKVHEDNSLVRAALEQPGEGRVLVVDGGGSLRCALVGDNLAMLGVENGWAGIIVYGCIRDAAPIAALAIGVKALATNPRKSVKKGEGERDVVLRFAEVSIAPGDYLYADEDGVVVAGARLD